MKRPSSLFSLLGPLAGAAALFVASVAYAGPATDLVKSKQAALFELLQSQNPDESKITAIFDEMLDYSTLAQNSMGDQWGKLTDAQKKEFTGLLKQLVQQAYEKNLRNTLSYDISYVSEEAADGGMKVDTKATSKNDKREDPIEISYTLKKGDSGSNFKVVDITTDDVSLVSSYRGQFVKTMNSDGYDGLKKKMKDKLNNKGS